MRQEFNCLQQALKKSAIDEVGFREIFSATQALTFKQFITCYEQCTATDIADFAHRIGMGMFYRFAVLALHTLFLTCATAGSLNRSVKGTIALTSVLFEPKLREIEHLLSPLRWGDVISKKLLFFCRSVNDLSYDLHFPDLLAFFRYFQVSDKFLKYLTDPTFPVEKLQLFQELLSPVHVEHEKDKVCRSLFCSVEEEVAKTPQQLEFEDLSRGISAGSSARRVEMLGKFLDAATLAKNCVETVELVEVRSAMLRIVCEFENLRISATEVRNEKV